MPWGPLSERATKMGRWPTACLSNLRRMKLSVLSLWNGMRGTNALGATHVVTPPARSGDGAEPPALEAGPFGTATSGSPRDGGGRARPVALQV